MGETTSSLISWASEMDMSLMQHSGNQGKKENEKHILETELTELRQLTDQGYKTISFQLCY